MEAQATEGVEGEAGEGRSRSVSSFPPVRSWQPVVRCLQLVWKPNHWMLWTVCKADQHLASLIVPGGDELVNKASSSGGLMALLLSSVSSQETLF